METPLDPWKMFCEMCRQVAENRDVILDVCVLMNGIVEMHLSPLEDEYEDFDEDMYQD